MTARTAARSALLPVLLVAALAGCGGAPDTAQGSDASAARPGTAVEAPTPAAPAVEDEGPGTGTVPSEPTYACVDGVCDTYGEGSEGPGTD